MTAYEEKLVIQALKSRIKSMEKYIEFSKKIFTSDLNDSDQKLRDCFSIEVRAQTASGREHSIRRTITLNIRGYITKFENSLETKR